MNVHDGIGADVRDVGDGHGEARDGGPRRRRGGGNYQPTGVGDASRTSAVRRDVRRSKSWKRKKWWLMYTVLRDYSKQNGSVMTDSPSLSGNLSSKSASAMSSMMASRISVSLGSSGSGIG